MPYINFIFYDIIFNVSNSFIYMKVFPLFFINYPWFVVATHTLFPQSTDFISSKLTNNLFKFYEQKKLWEYKIHELKHFCNKFLFFVVRNEHLLLQNFLFFKKILFHKSLFTPSLHCFFFRIILYNFILHTICRRMRRFALDEIWFDFNTDFTLNRIYLNIIEHNSGRN